MTASPSLPLALTMGDPAGCGPQITAAAWQALRAAPGISAYVIGEPSLYTDHCDVSVITSPGDAGRVWPEALPVLPITEPLGPVETGTPSAQHAPTTLASIRQAVQSVQGGEASAVVTNPISKAVLYEAGFAHPGHTEFLAELCLTDRDAEPLLPVMMLVGGGLRVALATIHIPLTEVASALSIDHLTRTAEIVHADLQSRFGIRSPRLAFTGLNPHAGESGTIGREEVDIINPAAATLRSVGVDIVDARPGDTVFAEMLDGQFDAIIAMTHDQGLIPVKTLDFWGGVNCTLGLPIIRTSPDHGTAYDAAAAGTARPDSLIAAIRLAADMAARP